MAAIYRLRKKRGWIEATANVLVANLRLGQGYASTSLIAPAVRLVKDSLSISMHQF